MVQNIWIACHWSSLAGRPPVAGPKTPEGTEVVIKLPNAHRSPSTLGSLPRLGRPVGKKMQLS
eukprot:7710592-Pyramimonas_sp.AAC.1